MTVTPPTVAPLPAVPELPALTPKAPAKPAETLPPSELPPAPKTVVVTPPTAKAAKDTPPPAPPVVAPALSPGAADAVNTSVAFPKDMTELSDAAKKELAEIAEKVKRSQASVRVVGYASGSADQASMARRISLSRALAVRAYLIDKGVNRLSITAQALGNQVPSGEPDRADIFVK